MTVCGHCEQEMLEADGCTRSEIVISLGPGVSETFKRVPFEGFEDGERCHDCGVVGGGVHHRACDVERCPRCSGQLLTCACLAPADYKLTDEQWKELLDYAG